MTAPKDRGGLGIINLTLQNNTLLMKNLRKFYNKTDIAWLQLMRNTHYPNGQIPHATRDRGSVWWKDIMKLSDLFRSIATPSAGDGGNFLTWQDVWNGLYLKQEYPRLFSFCKKAEPITC
jgi:hypothetical protein